MTNKQLAALQRRNAERICNAQQYLGERWQGNIWYRHIPGHPHIRGAFTARLLRLRTALGI